MSQKKEYKVIIIKHTICILYYIHICTLSGPPKPAYSETGLKQALSHIIVFSSDVADGSIDFVIIPETGLAATFSSDAGSDDPIDSVNWVLQK